MPQIASWTYSGASPARSLRLEAVKICSTMLPQPYSYNTSLLHQGRMARLEKELAEFDYRFRIARGLPARLDQLVCIGTFLINSSGGRIPADSLPLEEDLLINRHTLPLLVRWMDETLGNDAEA